MEDTEEARQAKSIAYCERARLYTPFCWNQIYIATFFRQCSIVTLSTYNCTPIFRNSLQGDKEVYAFTNYRTGT
jgi:hypothetical protein